MTLTLLNRIGKMKIYNYGGKVKHIFANYIISLVAPLPHSLPYIARYDFKSLTNCEGEVSLIYLKSELCKRKCVSGF